MSPKGLFITGGTGLIGSRVLALLLRRQPGLRAFVLVRASSDWPALERHVGVDWARCTPINGDLLLPGLGLSDNSLETLRQRVDLVIHAAADTSFSQPLEHARRLNVTGTEHVIRLAESLPRLRRFVHLSTAFVAGTARGQVLEEVADRRLSDATRRPDRWVNAYEQSKYEAEVALQESTLPWVILRPSTVVCDDPRGAVSQVGAIHRALRLYHSGLAALMPGRAETPVDVVTGRYVAECAADLAVHSQTDSGVFHLCAGKGALALGELLESSHRVWSESPDWRRRGIDTPALADLPTYRRFEESVAATGNARVRAITEALTHFVPQLAFAKTFDTTRAESALGIVAAPVRDWWPNMVRHLVHTRWLGSARRAS